MGTDLPPDPEDDGRLAVSLQGIHDTARLLGTLRRELEAEGFDQDECYELCEVWVKEGLARIDDSDEDDGG